MRTVVDVIADQAGGSGALTRLAAHGQAATSLPWSAMREPARRMASMLAGSGFGRGCRVGLLGDTSVDLVTALQVVWLCGVAVSVLPRPTRRADNLQAIVVEVGLAPPVVLVILYGQLPKTSSGKLRRAETRRQHLLGQLGSHTLERSVR